jgi:PAS domain S-box-containing protein
MATDVQRFLAELDNLYRTAPVGLCLLDTELRYVHINEHLAAYNGLSPAAHLGKRVEDVVPQLADDIVPTCRRVIETGEAALNLEMRGATASEPDVERSWLVSYVPVKLQDGTVAGLNTVVTEITEQKRTLDELRMFRHILFATNDHMSFVDANYVYRAVSDAYLVAMDRPRHEIVGHAVEELLGTATFRDVVKPNIDRCLAGKQVRYQDWFTFPGIGRRFMDVVYNPFVDGEGKTTGVVVSARDLTDRREMEEELVESRVRLEQIANTIEDVAWITDLNQQQVMFASPAYEQIWGRPVEQLYRNARDWAEGIHPEDRERAWQAAMGLAKNRRYDEEYRVIRPDGSTRWVRDRGYPVRDADGEIHRVVGIAQDITERKRADDERRRLEGELRHAHKMQAVGQLAAGIAHDVNSLLMVVLGNTELAQLQLKRGGGKALERAAAALEQVHTAVERGKALVQNLLAFGRAGAWNPRPVDLNDVVKKMKEMLTGLVGQGIRIQFHVAPGLRQCRLDSIQIEQAILNLILNARDAMSGRGTVTIQTSNVDTIASAAEPRVMLAVTDSGIGMDEATRERIFEPFFTTKPVDKGTGLGLSIIYGIVEQARGEIRVESEPERGTTVRLYFPAAEPAPEAPAALPDENV